MKDILNNKDIIYNLDYIVCLPQYDSSLYEAFSYSFRNVILIKDNVSDVEKIIQFVKNNNIKNVIFVDFLLEYNNIIKTIDLDVEVKFILTKPLAAITNMDIYQIVNSVFELHKKNMFKELGVLDENWYECLKDTDMDVKLLSLDIEKETLEEQEIENDKKSTKELNNKIGILSEEYNANHSFYNQLSAIKLNGKYIPNLLSVSNIAKDFNNVFDIEYNITQNSDYIKENLINLYINFTDNNNMLFLKSMDLGVPCIMGNTKLFNDYPELSKYLTVESEDDINEISRKIDIVIQNKELILKEYKKFRKDYIVKSKQSIDSFLAKTVEYNSIDDENYIKELDNDDGIDTLLLTVVVPVYNTEKYIAECLDSIYDARIDNMEILVINDGSTDNSEKVIKEYVEKYPNLIRYIKQENHGLGNVRNVGLKNAKGKYIVSVDSDDSIDKNFLKDAKPYLENDIDIVICDWLSLPENGEKFETSALDYIFKDIGIYKGLLYTTIMPSTCNKILKKSLIKSIGYNYAEGLKYEDLSFNPLVMLKAETIKYINKPYYLYKIRGDSIMRTSAGYNMIDIIKMLDDRLMRCFKQKNKLDLEEFKYYTYTWRIEEFVFNQIYNLKNEEEVKEFINYTISKIGNIMKEIYFTEFFIKGLDKLKAETKKYILDRNKAMQDGNLYEFLSNSIKNNTYIKITPPMFFYGEN